MAYSKQNFQDGQILNAANLEAMENGIIAGQGAKNLLVNSNFMNPIDIDNLIGTVNANPCFTRWNFERASSSVTTQIIKIDNGIRVYKNGGVARFYQSLNYNFLNKKVSYAISTSEGIFVGSCTVSGNSSFTRIGTHTGYISAYQSSSSGNLIFSLYFNDSSEDAIDIYWAALYEGAYTKETLPGYISKSVHQEMLDCGVPLYPKNLLKNSDFTNPLNTKGFSSISSGAYTTIDCWKSWISGNGGKIELTSSGIKLSPPSSENIGIYQQIENYQLNKIYTVVVYINNLPYLKSFQMGNFGVGTKLGPVYFYSIPSANVLIRINSTDSAVTIQKIALYEGAYTLDTIPMYQSESKHVEMLNCNVPLTPHNLLDNSDFRNPVNQRGQTTYTGSAFTVDRWRTWNDSATITLTSDGIKGGGTDATVLYQGIELHKIKLGTAYTVAIGYSDSTISCATGTLTASSGVGIWNDEIQAFLLWNDGSPFMRLWHATKTIQWAAIYPGAYDASTLPAYQPKGYAAELAECQRYYYQSWTGSSPVTTAGMKTVEAYSNYGTSLIDLPQEMRANPTITVYDVKDGTTNQVREWVNETVVILNSATVNYRSNKRFSLASGGNFIKNEHYYFHYSASADL